MSTLSPNSRQFLAAGTLGFELDHPRVGTRGSNELEGVWHCHGNRVGSQRLKVTLAISWSCVISAKMVAAQTGLDALIWFAIKRLAIARRAPGRLRMAKRDRAHALL
jgi:hypothetical protein